MTSRRQPPARLLTAATALVVTAFAVAAGTASAEPPTSGPELDPAFCDGVVGYQAATTGFPDPSTAIAGRRALPAPALTPPPCALPESWIHPPAVCSAT